MSLATLIEEIDHLSITANNRVKCSITGHEMPANLSVVQVETLRPKNPPTYYKYLTPLNNRITSRARSC